MLRTTILRTTRRTFVTTTPLQKIIPEATQTTPGKQPEEMNTDNTAKAMDQSSNSAIGNAEMSSGIHESSQQAGSVGGNTAAADTPVFHKDGAVGKQFQKTGAIGSIGEKVGGPFASDGVVGKNFNPDGAIGGTIHENLGKKQ